MPSIWVGKYSSYDEYSYNKETRKNISQIFDGIDDRILISRHSFNIDAWCVNCNDIQKMNLSWHYGGVNNKGSVHPAWTETAVCNKCGLNSRMRALLSFITEKLCLDKSSFIYMAEQITPAYKAFKSHFNSVVGSEYINEKMEGGAKKFYAKGHILVRHEDLTALSFNSGTYDALITQDVFEHIPDYFEAFKECKRVLKEGGHLIFTIPFFPDSQNTEVRAVIENGSIGHILPPEYHGNPIGSEGSLCFQHFGWDILDDLSKVGFKEVTANLYWGPWQGHLGSPFFVFSAKA